MASLGNRRCPPRVLEWGSLPSFAHLVTVFGETWRMSATSAVLRYFGVTARSFAMRLLAGPGSSARSACIVTDGGIQRERLARIGFGAAVRPCPRPAASLGSWGRPAGCAASTPSPGCRRRASWCSRARRTPAPAPRWSGRAGACAPVSFPSCRFGSVGGTRSPSHSTPVRGRFGDGDRSDGADGAADPLHHLGRHRLLAALPADQAPHLAAELQPVHARATPRQVDLDAHAVLVTELTVEVELDALEDFSAISLEQGHAPVPSPTTPSREPFFPC